MALLTIHLAPQLHPPPPPPRRAPLEQLWMFQCSYNICDNYSSRMQRAQAVVKEKFPSEHSLTRWERHLREDVRRRSIHYWVVRAILSRWKYPLRILVLQPMVDKILHVKVLQSADVINPNTIVGRCWSLI